MTSTAILRAAALAVAALAPVACSDSASRGSAPDGFRAAYMAARGALEQGDYDAAERGYLRLVQDAGALAPRLRLELAHTLLRAEDFARARTEARTLATTLSGSDALAARAVQATAEHELALGKLAAGDRAAAAKLMRAAREGMQAVLDGAPELDPAGALAGRRATLEVQIARL